MKDYNELLKSVAVRVPRVILPDSKVKLERFSVIACDQFSAEPSYWQEVGELVGDSPSALGLMLPEAFLSSDNFEKTKEINSNMQKQLEQGTLFELDEAMILVEREVTSGVRHGLVVALDLEQYDFSPDSKSLIRATESTVVERLPPRVEIRKNALLEMPHVMVLIDDVDDSVIGGLVGEKANLPCVYDFELMKNGGHIKGFLVNGEQRLWEIACALNELMQKSDGMLYAMGDGNHSFAAAKACWQALKPSLSPEEQLCHPARFSLVELVNIYDEGMYIEPIHRLLFNVDGDALQAELGFDANNPPSLQVLQPSLDEWLSRHPGAELEYIHGEEQCRRLANQPNRLAIIFGEFDKSSVFEIVKNQGSFVRKSFSIGRATDKRYYLECRRIK